MPGEVVPLEGKRRNPVIEQMMRQARRRRKREREQREQRNEKALRMRRPSSKDSA